MRNHKRLAVIFLASIFCFSLSGIGKTIDWKNPPAGVFYDQHFSLNLGKTKCGWAWFQLERKNDRIITRNKTTMKVGRESLVIEVSSTSETEETLDGKPVRFNSETVMAGSKTINRGEFKGDMVTMEIVQGGQMTKHKFNVPADTVMGWGDHLESVKYLNKPGATYSIHSFEPAKGPGPVGLVEVKVVGPGSAQIAGQTVSGTKIIAKSEDLGPFPITSYMDANGFMLSTELQVGIMKVQMVAVSEQEAKSNLKVEEIFGSSFVKLSKPLNPPTSRGLTLKISTTGGAPLPVIPETTMQRIVSREGNTVVLQIRGPNMIRFNRQSSQPTSAHLASSSYMKLDDPALVRLAEEGSKSAKKTSRVAENLCKFVYTYIKEKNLEKPFASASETARSKAGDCSEHAVLMAALARVKKIPSQVVSGLVFTPQGGEYGSFGYHMWTQVWLNGQWVDMDPTFGQIEPDATHIALIVQDMSDETFTQQAIKLAQFVGQLRIEPGE